ncbi:MAG: response regulator [Firmicutes bacterium]|nr:response regulator [Bacillota bacterium]
MIKVVIADDEKKVCHLIQNLIDWDEMGVNIVGTANDGKAAYNLILQHEPDIVITDIRMPGFNGIDLVKKIKEIGLSTRFIIISGYRHFEYAHKAIKYGVEEYLLKPIKKEALKAAVEKIKKKTTKNYKKYEHFFISNTIFYPEKTEESIVKDLNLNFKDKLQTGLTNIIFLKIDNKKNKDIEIINNILDKISKISKKIYNNINSEFITYIIHSGIIFVINYPSKNSVLIKKSYSTLFEKVSEYLDLFDNFVLTLGIGYPVSNITEISSSIQMAINAIIARIKIGTNKIIFPGDMNFTEYKIVDILTVKRENALRNAMETLNKVGIEQSLVGIFNELRFREYLNPRIIIEISKNIINISVQTLKRHGLQAKNEIELRDFISQEIDRALSINDIYNLLLQSIYKEIDIINSRKRDEDNKPVREAKKYIHKHYMEKITLSEVAEIVHFSSDYFSTVFKKEVGINFSEYLINYRLDKAKNLLINTDMTIALISGKVGYTDSRYFSKLFREKIGIKPSEYRKLYL